MSEGEDDNLVVSRERLSRIGEVLSYLSIEEFSKPLITIEPVEDEFGVTEQMVSQFALDHAAAMQALRELDDERSALIERLQDALKALSTPIIDIWEGVLTLPIVGIVDTERAAEMTERLLERLSSTDAHCVIIDVTGVDEVDDATAANLLKMVRSAQLLGAYAVITGISPTVAQTLVALGVDTGDALGFRTLRSLNDGLRDCLRHLRRGAGRRG